MQLQLPAFLDSPTVAVACAVAGIVTSAATLVAYELSDFRKLSRIPTVGSSSWLGSWWAGRQFEKNAQRLVQEGYERYRTLPFKVADSAHWTVIVSGRRHIEELRKAPDDTLSFLDAINVALKLEYTFGRELLRNPYHVETIRAQLTRNIGGLFPDIRDEISVAFDEVLSLEGTEWKSVPALRAIQKVVSRTSNRMFVGLPLCRDPGWIGLNLRYVKDIVDAGDAIRRFSNLLAPIVVNFMTDLTKSTKRACTYLAPIIEERLQLLEEHGDDWDAKPNDLLSWLLEEAPEGPERSVRLLTARILAVNFGAIHTSSNSFAHALFLLAENPQYIKPLREEVETIAKEDGWSKASLTKMHKIDSFLKETQRLVGIGSLVLNRMAMKDFSFSDGTFIPKGTLLAAPSWCLHHDDEYYENAHVFNPFRFSDMREEEGGNTKHHFVSTSAEYLTFGHGKHACPGRFFAANELKLMLAHVVVAYDIKLGENKTRPRESRNWSRILPDPLAEVLFRRRVD